MTQVSGLTYQVNQNHLRNLNNAQEKMAQAATQGETEGPSFADRLNEGLKEVADAQKTAADLATAFETGKEQDLTKVMVAQQVSGLGFDLTLNVRNKALSAYKDIMNMPV